MPHLDAAIASAEKHYVPTWCLTKLNRPDDAAREREQVGELRAREGAPMEAKFRAARYPLGGWLPELDEVINAERSLANTVGLCPDEPAMRLARAAAMERAGR